MSNTSITNHARCFVYDNRNGLIIIAPFINRVRPTTPFKYSSKVRPSDLVMHESFNFVSV